MARQQQGAQIRLSVLDRLIDFDPAVSVEAPLSRPESIRRYKDAVRRDLEWLLNSRRIAHPAPESFGEVNASVYNYGLADLTSFNLASLKDYPKLLRTLQLALKRFEPRLANVRVSAIETPDVTSRKVHFRIEGILRMDTLSEHVSYETTLELTSGQYAVRGDAHA